MGCAPARQTDAIRSNTEVGRVGAAGKEVTGTESRLLKVGDRVFWNADKNDAGTVKDKNWAGVTIKWDSRQEQTFLHNDMGMVTKG